MQLLDQMLAKKSLTMVLVEAESKAFPQTFLDFLQDFIRIKTPPELQFAFFCLQTNTTFIQNAAVRETILNLTLDGLAPTFVSFEVEDYELWFQVYLVPVIASLQPDSLRVIPRNISCESYEAM